MSQSLGLSVDVRVSAADYRSPALRGEQVILDQIPVPQAVVRPPGGECIALFAFLELSFDCLSIGDVAYRHDIGVQAVPLNRAHMHLDYEFRAIQANVIQFGKVFASKRKPERVALS